MRGMVPFPFPSPSPPPFFDYCRGGSKSPPEVETTMSQIKRLVVHCSDSGFGNAFLVDEWHKERGFRMIGYHYVILNGFPSSIQLRNKQRWNFLDGSIECGRNLDADPYLEKEEVGAHAYGFNRESVGICLIGKDGNFTPRQFYALRVLLNELRQCFNLPTSAVVGHYEINPDKTCPDINMEHLRQYLVSPNSIAPLYRRAVNGLAGNR